MSEEKKCAKPRCPGVLRKIEVESSWTIEKYHCSSCGHLYVVPTGLGKAAQVAPIATAGVMIASFLLAHDHSGSDG